MAVRRKEHGYLETHPRSLNANIERFTGFSDSYEQFRPVPPPSVVHILTAYLRHSPRLVVDVGSGTGLSTYIWADQAERVVGIEPNVSMRQQAEAKPTHPAVSFQAGYAHELPLETNSVDIITCSQSFHWLNPAEVLPEFGRVLVHGGVFAAYDCDWPPAVDAAVEQSYERLFQIVDELTTALDAAPYVSKWDKSEHLVQLRQSGVFSYVKEVVFDQTSLLTAPQYFGLAFSQGGLQAVLKNRPPALIEALDAFRDCLDDTFGNTRLPVWFSYRMRLGVK
jgi:ubiquinone/menaquinone biosynthesis C-methylase UbiE